MNEPNVTRTVMEVGQQLIGDHASLLGRPLTVSDDFAEFLTRIPGCYFMLGARPDGDTPPAHHSPGLRIDASALPVGVKVLAVPASRLAAEHPVSQCSRSWPSSSAWFSGWPRAATS